MSPPRPWAIITRAASRETRNEPRAITSCWTSQSATVVSSSGLEIDRPALLTTRSSPPNASTAARTAAAMPSSLVTSTLTPPAAPPGAQPLGGGPADPGPAPGDQGDPGGQRLGLGAPAQLGLFQFPVLDAKFFGFRNGPVGRDGLGP